jgi:hypothetical protein
MYQIRKATITDVPSLLILIKKINEKEKRYLMYDQDSDQWLKRLLKNIQENHVILFIISDKLFGFLEYDIQAMSKIWVYSLYFQEDYRWTTYKLLIPVFNGMKKIYDMPIHFAVYPDNYPMDLLVKFIRAEIVEVYTDTRVEYCVRRS